MEEMSNHTASETSLASRGETGPTESCGAGQSVVVQQQLVVGSGASGTVPRMTTARSENPFSQGKAEVTPRFLVVGRKDGANFDKVSPFLISRQLFGLVGSLRTIKKTKQGLLIETVSEAQSKKVQKLEKLGDINIEVIPHKTLNFSKGIVTCRDFLNCTIQEIYDELKAEGVIEVKRITQRRNNEIIDPAHHILTFNKPKLPYTIKAAFYVLPVRQYIPNPTRCFKCQRFGHVSTRCSNEEICRCGLPTQDHGVCMQPPRCVNCGRNHLSNTKDCPKMKEEVSIQNIKTLKRITYAEAKKKYLASLPANTTYAQATTSNSQQNRTKEMLDEIIPNITKIIEDEVKKVYNAISQIRAGVMMPPPINRPIRLSQETFDDSMSVVSDTTS